MKNIGLYFGSFNPVHIGHTAIAGYMTEFTDIDQVWFIVSPHNPLKKKETLLDNYQRLYMVQLATEHNDNFKVSDIEFNLPVPSYTVDTLIRMEEKYQGNKFSLIMGEDNLQTLHKWKNVSELIKRYPIYVYPRPQINKRYGGQMDKILADASIHYVNAPVMDISGSFIRKGIKSGKDMSYFLASPVWKYIEEMHFYIK